MHARTEIFVFEPFRLEPERRLLMANGRPITLTSRAFDILEYLVRNRDRVVTREEIVAYVWRGVTVGGNNLSVQMSVLRHALAEPCGKKQLIVNIPGRGYRFIVEVDAQIELDEPAVDQVRPSAADQKTERSYVKIPNRYWPRRSTVLVATGLILIVTVSSVEIIKIMSTSTQTVVAIPPDLRLSVGVGDFVGIGGKSEAAILAEEYRRLTLSNLEDFPELKLYPPNGTTIAPRFKLTGSITVDDHGIRAEITVQEGPSWQIIDTEVRHLPAQVTDVQRASAATQMIAGIRSSVFRAEHELRGDRRPDALDLLVDAQLAAADTNDPVPVAKGVLLARQALRKNHGLIPAKAFLALLLADSVQLSVASAGEADAVEAQSLIQEVLHDYPMNPVYIGFKAYIMLTLERENEAQLIAENGLSVSPGYYSLEQLLVAAFMMTNQLGEADIHIGSNPGDPWDDRPAYLSYLETNYAIALRQIDNVLISSGTSWSTGFTMLFKVSILMKLDKALEAKKALHDALAELSPRFRHVSALRRCYYALPPEAWKSVVQDLRAAGMPL